MIENEMIENEMIENVFSLIKTEKREKFYELWSLTKSHMEEKLKFQQYLLQVLVRCVGFITSSASEDGEEFRENNMQKFMNIDDTHKKIEDHNGNQQQTKLFDFKQQDQILNIYDFIKNIKKVNEFLLNENDSQLLSEIVKDFAFSNVLFNKCEDLLNLFFNNQSNYCQNIKKLIWTFYIYSRKKFLNNSRNLLESLPVLISLIDFILVQIDNKRFACDLIQGIEKEIKSNLSESREPEHAEVFIQKKRQIIVEKLVKRTGGHIDVHMIDKMKSEFVKYLSKEEEIMNYFSFSNSHTVINLKFSLEDESSVIGLIEAMKKLYSMQLKFKHFDERILMMHNKNSDCSPVKLTPFKRQKFSSTSENFMDKRPLTNNTFRKIMFEEAYNSTNKMNLNTTTSENNFSQGGSHLLKGIDLREISKKMNESMRMTPCTRVIIMDKWVKDYIKNWSNEKLQKYENELTENIFPMLKENLDKIQRLLESYHVKIVTSIHEIEKLILKLIYGLLNKDERIFRKEFVGRLLKNINFLKSAIVVGVEIVLFIENVEYISFYKIANALELDLYDFWKIINPFIHFDLTMPSDIRIHFQEIEIQLWLFMIWKKPSTAFKEDTAEFVGSNTCFSYDREIKKIEDMEFNNQSLFVYQEKSIFQAKDFLEQITPIESKDTNMTSSSTAMASSIDLQVYKHLKPIYIFLRRIINYFILVNKKISEHLKLNTETAKECEVLFKSIVTNKNYFDVLYNKHIDQVIICCIIAILKRHSLYELKNCKCILEAYKKAKSEDSEGSMKSLFYTIKMSDHSQIDIVEFYNNHFIKRVENLVKEVCMDESERDLLSSRRRKMSLPDAEMRKMQFESETAFEKEIIIYEPLKRTVFFENNSLNMIGTPHLLISKNTPISYSVRSSPLVSRSMYTSPALNRTPRSKVLKDLYSDYITSETLVMSNQSQEGSGGGNIFKNKIKMQLSASKSLLNKIDAQSPVNKNYPIESPSHTFSQQSDSPDLSKNNSQETPEFIKIKKDN